MHPDQNGAIPCLVGDVAEILRALTPWDAEVPPGYSPYVLKDAQCTLPNYRAYIGHPTAWGQAVKAASHCFHCLL